MARLKTRTREHVIADLGVNFVERQVLLAGFTLEELSRDYGIDLMIRTFSATGEVEGGHINVQVKATDGLRTHVGGATIPFRVDTADMRAWLIEALPVVLVLYDAQGDRAFWLDVKHYARANDLDEDPGGETLTLRIPSENVWHVAAARLIQAVKNDALDYPPK